MLSVDRVLERCEDCGTGTIMAYISVILGSGESDAHSLFLLEPVLPFREEEMLS